MIITSLERTRDSNKQTEVRLRPEVKRPRMPKVTKTITEFNIRQASRSVEQGWPTFSVKRQTVIIWAWQALVSFNYSH